jgi:hypothetical protein
MTIEALFKQKKAELEAKFDEYDGLYRKRNTLGKTRQELLAEGWIISEFDDKLYHKKMNAARGRKFREEIKEVFGLLYAVRMEQQDTLNRVGPMRPHAVPNIPYCRHSSSSSVSS